jgi:ABC-type bacteriocin/lantibiotic exporter with double-glycine peptidase domain
MVSASQMLIQETDAYRRRFRQVALERINEFSTIAQEAPEFVEPRPSASWPERGDILVKNLTIRYAPSLPNVLHGLTFEVKSKSKIGMQFETHTYGWLISLLA